MSGSGFAGGLGLAAAAVLVCAMVIVWRRSATAIVHALALQGASLGTVALLLGLHQRSGVLVLVSVLVVAVKGAVVPRLLARVVAGDPASRETAPLVNVPASLVTAGALSFLAYAVARPLAALAPPPSGRLVFMGMAVLLIGFFVMASRRQAISQIVGLLLVDNGIALVAFLATAGVPLLLELGASLDVMLVVVVLRVLATRMQSVLGRVDIGQLRELHD
ncbi:MAG TPA: hypothetical protein VMW47_03930 [Verrucomicrobiae bacterium]|nr:hypothetical protein [Verrucomicrobiae bacterium]